MSHGPSRLRVDHLFYTVPDLYDGIEKMGRRLGVVPTPGGVHPDYGTANALVALGPDSYLEIIGPDPHANHGGNLMFLGMDFSASKLATWVAKASLTDPSPGLLPEVFGSVEAGHRDQPDGVRLTWLLSDPSAPRFDGVVPVLIDWQDTPHPASSLAQECELLDLRLKHPTPSLTEDSVGGFGGGITVAYSDHPGLTATLDTPNGTVELT